MYCAVSSKKFDCFGSHLLIQYPAGKNYLEKELYHCHEKWAWAWEFRQMDELRLRAESTNSLVIQNPPFFNCSMLK
ncbi:hypothetical protein CVT25_007180 [Psilocybe cyanescens]|uniref:Uncharacterized protein n=1 Tax=Psilocybe cyanescens TaxID=93625 RepID=A0A409X6W8_PSICY|nr:hypothetical protein CVT25_007180 [Psilocybe cyanescens]